MFFWNSLPFLELSCQDPVDDGNLISGSSAFSKTSLNIWKFTVHVLLNLFLFLPGNNYLKLKESFNTMYYSSVILMTSKGYLLYH